MCGNMDNLDLGDTVEYTLSKGKGNKVSAEKVTRVPYGIEYFYLNRVILSFKLTLSHVTVSRALSLIPEGFKFHVENVVYVF